MAFFASSDIVCDLRFILLSLAKLIAGRRCLPSGGLPCLGGFLLDDGFFFLIRMVFVIFSSFDLLPLSFLVGELPVLAMMDGM